MSRVGLDPKEKKNLPELLKDQRKTLKGDDRYEDH
jgi:hypothetical protein